jgi:hypothetical protein
MNPNPPTQDNPRDILRAIRIFFRAIVTGPLIFTAIIIVLNWVEDTASPAIKGSGNILLIIAAAIAVVCFIVARTSYNKGLKAANDSPNSLQGKLNQYRNALIRYAALCEGPALFGIILSYVIANYLFLVITAVMLVALLAKAPTKERVVRELSLDWQQQQELE